MKKIYLLVLYFLFGTYNIMAQDLEMFVSSTAEDAIKKYDENGTFLGNFIPANSGGLDGPQDIIFLDDNTVIVSGIQNTAIKQYNATTGDYIGDFTSGYSLNQPTRMVIRDNLLYVIQWANTNNKVVRFDMDGNFVDEFTSIGIPQSIGIDWDEAGNLYVSSFGQGPNGFVQKFDTSGNDMGVFIDSSILQGPTNIWFDDNQDLLVEDWTLGIVRRFSSTGQFLNNFITGMTNPEGVAFLPNGNILICDWGTDTVEQFDSNGNALGTFASGNGIADPNAVVFRDPNLSVPDQQMNPVFVTPTVGDRFSFNMDLIADFKSLYLLDLNGRIVRTFYPLDDNRLWKADGLEEGLYFISAINKNSKAVQKIIIKK